MVGPQAHEVTCNEQIIQVKVNGKIAAPGRVPVNSITGSLELDITGACDYDPDYDTDAGNKVAIQLYRGMNVSNGPIHALNGRIDQYRRIKPVEE